jgi:hypothetical protein
MLSSPAKADDDSVTASEARLDLARVDQHIQNHRSLTTMVSPGRIGKSSGTSL